MKEQQEELSFEYQDVRVVDHDGHELGVVAVPVAPDTPVEQVAATALETYVDWQAARALVNEEQITLFSEAIQNGEVIPSTLQSVADELQKLRVTLDTEDDPFPDYRKEIEDSLTSTYQKAMHQTAAKLLTDPSQIRTIAEDCAISAAASILGDLRTEYGDARFLALSPDELATLFHAGYYQHGQRLIDALQVGAQRWWDRMRNTIDEYAADPKLRTQLEEAARKIALRIAKESDPDSVPRKSNRKITLPYDMKSLIQMPNIIEHGTRHLGQVVAGGAEWEHDANHKAMMARIDGNTVGMIDLSEGSEEAANRIIHALGPRALQTVVATSKLVYEKTKGMPINRVATLDVREIAIACGKKPDKARHIDPDTLRRIGEDLRAASKIQTWGADGDWDTKRHAARSGWIAPILVIPAVHVEQLSMDGDPVPYEFDVLLGRNWAKAIKEQYDVMQIAPGFMKLDPSTENQTIRLAWYYSTEFRYRMKRGPKKTATGIPEIVDVARLEWDSSHLKRSLARLHKAHQRLADLQIIGTFERTPAAGVEDDPRGDWPPRKVYEQGGYRVDAPPAIIAAYEEWRQKALAEKKNRLPKKAAAQ